MLEMTSLLEESGLIKFVCFDEGMLEAHEEGLLVYGYYTLMLPTMHVETVCLI